jgi:hypothetical protein
MYRRLLVIASLVAAVGATAAVPAVAKQSCGTTELDQGGRASVTIVKGHVSCAAARGIVKLYGSKTGTPHNTSGPRSQMYDVPGWVVVRTARERRLRVRSRLNAPPS